MLNIDVNHFMKLKRLFHHLQILHQTQVINKRLDASMYEEWNEVFREYMQEFWETCHSQSADAESLQERKN